MFVRWITGLLFALLALVVLWVDPLVWLAFLLCCVTLAGFEWGRLTELPGLLAVILFLPAAGLAAYQHYPLLPLFVLLAGLPLIVKGQVETAIFAHNIAAGIVWLCIPVGLLFQLRVEYGFWMVLGLLLGTAVQDTGALYCGMLFRVGRGFAGQVSPNKTWSGFIGGSLAIILLFTAFSFWEWWELPVPLGVATAILLGIASPVGDLMISGLKRRAQLDDTGSYLPGHGGILDRVDGLLMNTVVFYVILYLGS